MTLTDKDINEIKRVTSPKKLNSFSDNKNITKDMLLIELQRINDIINNRVWFDYDSQTWINE